MNDYKIFLSDDDLLTTIAPKTIDNRAHSSLILIGQGVPDSWKTIDQDLVWLMENFSKTTPPLNPLAGQNWYDSAHGRMNVYTGEDWFYLLTPETSCNTMFDMLDTAVGIDFTLTGSVPIFTASDLSKTYLPTSLLLVPRGPITTTTSPTINVSAMTVGDILTSRSVPLSGNSGVMRLDLNPYCQMVNHLTPTVSLNITTVATGGDLVCDAYLYGFVAPFLPRPPIIVAVDEFVAATDFSVTVFAGDGYGRGLYGLGPYQTPFVPGTNTYGAGGYGIGPYGQGGELVHESLAATDAPDAVRVPLVLPLGSYGARGYGHGPYQSSSVFPAGVVEIMTTTDLVDAEIDLPGSLFGAGSYGSGRYGG